jgi:hypothetical protein
VQLLLGNADQDSEWGILQLNRLPMEEEKPWSPHTELHKWGRRIYVELDLSYLMESMDDLNLA